MWFKNQLSSHYQLLKCVIIAHRRRQLPKNYLFEFTERADIAYSRLPKVVQSQIDKVLRQIEQTGLRSRYITKIRDYEGMYLARAGTNIRIIFHLEDEIMTILDIVSHDKIQRISRLYD